MNLPPNKPVHDGTEMPFGKYKGFKLSEIPDHYWLWFVQQDWAAIEYPQFFRYAQIVEEENT